MDKDTERAVRCCSDTDLGYPWKKIGECSVWGATNLNGGCSGAMNFFEAKEYCELAGGRLCSTEEMASDCTSGTGCKYDSEMIWTSSSEFFSTAPPTMALTPVPSQSPTITRPPSPTVDQGIATCGKSDRVGYVNTNPGTDGCGPHEELIPLVELREVRCCSDIYLGTAWKKRGSCSVWGATKNLNDGCSGKISFYEAKDYCESAGGRLCTSEELVNDCTRGTGCNYDSAMIWSSSTDYFLE